MSDTYLTLNGARVISGSISLPYYGAWVADVVLAEEIVISEAQGACTLVLGNLTLIGTAFRTADFAGSRSARIVGGFGGWRKEIPARGYTKSGGVLASLVIRDAASEAGEQVKLAQDRTIGAAFVRDAGPASRVLRLLGGDLWWLDPSTGITQVGPRTGKSVSSPFTAVHWSGARGQFEIATDDISSWQPGATFGAPNVDGTQTVSLVRHALGNDGRARTIVLVTP